MTMTPGLRKLALTVHVTTSVGWLGAVAAFLALAVAGLMSQDAQLVRGSYLAMPVMTWYALVPLCLAALLSGIVSSLGTEWGLFRYYWIVVKLAITVLSTVIFLVHTQPIHLLAAAASTATAFDADLRRMQIQMAVAAGAALVVLLVLTGLSVYKPRGLTPYGWRKQYRQRAASAPTVGDATSQ
jgi:hypothetical protein